LDIPQLTVKTYDDVLARIKERTKIMIQQLNRFGRERVLAATLRFRNTLPREH